MSEEKDEQEGIRSLLKLSRQATPELLATNPPYIHVTKLDLPGLGLSELPDGFETSFPNLSILFMPKNNFSEMPAVIGRMEKLQMVAFKENNMKSIHPDALQHQLRWLILTNNQLTALPEELGNRCHKLQKCMLSGNKLKTLPESIGRCQNLELIRLASNQLESAPEALLSKCKKLSWVAVSDNPFTDGIAPIANVKTNILDIDFTNDDPVLGQGAGGVTRKVKWNGTYVAVKEYGGAIGSDGLPETERRLACSAGNLGCSALVQVLGETKKHGALVMEYLDGFVPLAGPPSMESCSRDVYAEDHTNVLMTTSQAELLVARLLEALAALHQAGICHGDFYGHNILLDPNDPSTVRLTDLGAAFFYDKNSDMAPYFQLAELRAFTIMVQEVYEHFIVKKNQEDSPMLKGLIAHLQKEITSEGPLPTLDSILIWVKQKQLTSIAADFKVDD